MSRHPARHEPMPHEPMPTRGTTRLARPLLLALGALVALTTLAIADMRRPDADAAQWTFMAGLLVAGFIPYAVLALAARTGPAWLALLAGLAMTGLDIAARVRIRWFPQDAQDGLLLVALPLWLIPATLVLWCAMAVGQGVRRADARRKAEAAHPARGGSDPSDPAPGDPDGSAPALGDPDWSDPAPGDPDRSDPAPGDPDRSDPDQGAGGSAPPR